MATSFPVSLDELINPQASNSVQSPSHSEQHADANDAIEALEAKVGIDGSSVVTSHDYKIAQLQSLVTSAVAGAKSIYQDVRNQSGSAFTKATPVYVSGSTGASGQLLVSAASNATEATSSKTMGITTSAISNNSNGQVISEGILEGIDTTGAADGDPVWLGVNGAKIYGLANKPSAPAHLVFLGIVIRGGQANTGSMYVKIQNGFELHELHNVEVSSLVNGNILAYDSTTQTWKNTNTIQSTASTVPLVVKASASQTANLTQWQDSGGNVLTRVQADGTISWGTGGSALQNSSGRLIVNPSSASAIAVIVKGATSQTANLQEWQDSVGTVLSYITASGALRVNSSFGGTQAAITAGSAATVGVIVRGATSQTANLQEWQNSSGAIIASIGPVGDVAVNGSVYTSNAYFGGAASYYNATINIRPQQTSYKGIVIQGRASQTGNLQEWQNSSANILAQVDAYGSASFGGNNILGSSLGIGVGGNASQKGITVRGTASQTANLQEWQDSAGTIYAFINPFGQLSIGLSPTIYGNSRISINTVAATAVGQVIRGVVSQTADLQQWQDSAGTVLAYVAANGHLLTPRLNITNGGNIVDSAGTTPYFAFGSNQIAIYARNAAYKPLVIQGAASQSANLQEWQQSDGTVLARIASNGVMKANAGLLAENSTLANYTALQVTSTITNGTGIIVTGASGQTANLQEWQNSAGIVVANVGVSSTSFMGTTASSIYNVGINTPANPNIMLLVGATGWVSFNSSSQTTGIYTRHVNLGTGDMMGIYSQPVTGNSHSSVWSIAAAIRSAGGASAVITQAYNFYAYSPTISSGTITNLYGLFINTQKATNVTNAYGIYQAGVDDLNIINGRTTINSGSTTYVPLTIKGIASQTANLTEWQNSSGTVLVSISANADLNVNTSSTGRINLGDGQISKGPGAGFNFNSGINSGNIYAQSTYSGSVALTVKGTSGQQQYFSIQDSSGSAGIYVDQYMQMIHATNTYFNGIINNSGNWSISNSGNLNIKQITSNISSTISINTASTVDTSALSSFTSMEYTLSIKQGSKIRSSKILVHTDGTSVDSTEYGIMEMGGGITGILVTASVSSTNAILQVTITDAATTNATVKLIKTML